MKDKPIDCFTTGLLAYDILSWKIELNCRLWKGWLFCDNFYFCFLFLIHDWAARWQCYNAPLFPQISSFLVATTIVLGCTPDTSQSNIHRRFFAKVKFGPSREYNHDELRWESIPFSWSTTSMYVLCLDPTSPFCFLAFFSLLAKEICSWKPYVAVVGLTLTRLFSLMHQFLSFLQNCWDDV